MDSPTSPTPVPETTAPEPSSLLDRLTNVFVAPGEVFTEVKTAPVNHSNWVVPLILVCLCGIFYSYMAFSQAGVLRGIEDAQDKAIQKQVASGKLTQAQADQAETMMEKFRTPMFLKIAGGAGAIAASVAGFALLTFGIWLGVKMFGAEIDFLKAVEIYGLALMIDVLQKIIRAWLVAWKENMLVTVSPTFFEPNPDLHSKKDILLSMIDPIDFWWLAVLSLGVSKCASISFGKALVLTATIWFGLRIVATVLTPG